MQGTLDFTGSEHWATFNFPLCTALNAHYFEAEYLHGLVQ